MLGLLGKLISVLPDVVIAITEVAARTRKRAPRPVYHDRHFWTIEAEGPPPPHCVYCKVPRTPQSEATDCPGVP